MADNETQRGWLAQVHEHPRTDAIHDAAAEAMLTHGKRVPDEHVPGAEDLVKWGLAFQDAEGFTPRTLQWER